MSTEEIIVSLGMAHARVRPGAHIAYFWESDAEFDRGVEFLIEGLRGLDHIVIFGHDAANAKVSGVLQGRGYAVDRLQEAGRLTVLGAASTGDATLASIGQSFQTALDAGAPLIRLLGNIGWGEPDWPHEHDILRFEAKVTAAARNFPCVVVCMYDVQSLPGRVVLHGAFETHPITVCGNLVRENTHYVEVDEFLARWPQRVPPA